MNQTEIMAIKEIADKVGVVSTEAFNILVKSKVFEGYLDLSAAGILVLVAVAMLSYAKWYYDSIQSKENYPFPATELLTVGATIMIVVSFFIFFAGIYEVNCPEAAVLKQILRKQ